MKKSELRAELDKLKIPYTDSDTNAVLKEKLGQAKLTENAGPPTPFQPFMLMDAEDENQIMAEIQGAMVDKFVFCFKDKGGHEVVGLSKAGVDQICRESSNKGEVYRIMETAEGKMDMEVKETEKTYQVRVRVGRYALIKDREGMPAGEQLLDTHVGSKQQQKYKKMRSGQLMLDPFGYEVACSKAIRNAKRDLLPYTFVTEMIKKFRKGGKNEKVIDMDAKATEGQIRFIHAVGIECGYTHEHLTALCKQEFSCESVAGLRMQQVNELVNMMKENKKGDTPEIDIEALGIFNEFGVTLKAKREAQWKSALSTCKGDTTRAKAFLRKKLGGK